MAIAPHVIAPVKRYLIQTAIVLATALAPATLYAESDDKPLEFERIVVTATLTESQLKDVPASITVITKEELLQSPIENIMQAVRESTGITTNSRGVGGRGVINLRGMDSHQTLILLNGKRTTTTVPRRGIVRSWRHDAVETVGRDAMCSRVETVWRDHPTSTPTHRRTMTTQPPGACNQDVSAVADEWLMIVHTSAILRMQYIACSF